MIKKNIKLFLFSLASTTATFALSCSQLTKYRVLGRTDNGSYSKGNNTLSKGCDTNHMVKVAPNSDLKNNIYLEKIKQVILKIGKANDPNPTTSANININPNTNPKRLCSNHRKLEEHQADPFSSAKKYLKHLFDLNQEEMVELCHLIKGYKTPISQYNDTGSNVERSLSMSIKYARECGIDREGKEKSKNFLDCLPLFDSSLIMVGDVFLDWTRHVEDPLALAVFTKFPGLVSEFIKLLTKRNKKVDINKERLFGKSILKYAIATHDLPMFDILMDQAPKIHINGEKKAFDLPDLFIYAVCYGTIEMVQRLIHQGADPNKEYEFEGADNHGNACRYALIHDRKDVFNFLIESGHVPDWYKPYKYDRTLLMDLAYTQYPGWGDMFIKLLSKETVITGEDSASKNVLMCILERIRYILTCSNHNEEFKAGYHSNDCAKQIFKDICADKRKMLLPYSGKDFEEYIMQVK